MRQPVLGQLAGRTRGAAPRYREWPLLWFGLTKETGVFGATSWQPAADLDPAGHARAQIEIGGLQIDHHREDGRIPDHA